MPASQQLIPLLYCPLALCYISQLATFKVSLLSKYLFLFFAILQALAKRRVLLNEMLLTLPHHMETEVAYAHNGVLENRIHRKPWKRGEIVKN